MTIFKAMAQRRPGTRRAIRVARTALLALASFAALQSHAFALEDTYAMSPEQRVWYFGGVYDAALIDPRTRDCARSVSFERFMQAMSRFVTELPADAASAQRKTLDRMPAAAVAQIVIETECRR